jgi:hypothetical protein
MELISMHQADALIVFKIGHCLVPTLHRGTLAYIKGLFFRFALSTLSNFSNLLALI